MARPKRSENSISTQEKIESAFWTLLEDNDYEKISIKMLALEAKVNHNSIYYYYNNIDDIAKSAFENAIIHDLTPVLSGAITNIDMLESFITNQPQVAMRIHRMHIFASAKSIYLHTLLKDGLINVWLSQSNKSYDDLSDRDKLELDFIFSGVIVLLGQTPGDSLKDTLRAILDDELGRAVLSTMRRILEFE